jgi:hypothetical protein
MRVLIANHSLGSVGGTQTSVRDLAFWLLAHGHSPVVFGSELGEAARQLERRTVPVTQDLASISVKPDVIHGNSALETMIALLHFPETPAVFVCHAWRGRFAEPPRFPRILRYVAVDDTCADRLRLRSGIPSERVVVLLNAVDLARFPRRSELPPRPRRALVFSNSAHELTHLPAVREACRAARIELAVVGVGAGNFVGEPESVLGGYDLVFAKAKCALEAMACGAAVILCDSQGLGGLVRSADVARLKRLNFGARSLTQPVSTEAISREIDKYDPQDAAAVSEEIRRTAGSDDSHRELLALLEGVIQESRSAQDGTRWRTEESRAAAEFLRRVSGDAYRDGGLSELTPVVQATHRLLTTPILGRALARGARWVVRHWQAAERPEDRGR